MADFWTDYICESLAPGFLQGPNGRKFLEALGEEKDDLRAQMMDAIKLRFPSKCDPSAYLLHAQRRALDIVPGESNAQTLSRILNAFPTKVLSGTDDGVKDTLRAFGVGATNTYGVPRTDGLGNPTVILKRQADFSPSWDFERFSSLPSWAVAYGSGYKVTDGNTFIKDGYLGTFEVKCRFRYAQASQVSDEYFWYINSSTCCYLRQSDAKVVLKVNGYSLVSTYAHAFAKGDLVTVKVRHDGDYLTLTVNGTDVANGSPQGMIIENVPLSYNPLAFYKASAEGLRFTDATHIDRIYDLGSSGDANRICAPVLSTDRALYYPTGLNGRPCLTGYPTTPFRTGAWNITQTLPATQYIVVQIGSGTVYFNNTGLPTNCVYGGSAGISAYAGGYGCTTPAISAVPAVLCVIFDGANSKIFVNNSTTPIVTGNAGGSVNGIWEFICWHAWGCQAFYAGAHDLSARTAIMQSLGADYGITVT